MSVFSVISSKATSVASKVMFQVSKNKSGILLVVGGTAVAAGTITACVASTKVKEKVQNFKDTRNRIEEDMERSNEIKDERPEMEYPVKEYRKDVTNAYKNLILDMIKLYGPSVILTTVGYTCLFRSHAVLKQRYLGLAAAYTALDQNFKAYRERVRIHCGEEVEHNLFEGIPMNEEEKEAFEQTKSSYEIAEITENYADFLIGPGDEIWDESPSYTLQQIECVRQKCQMDFERWGYLSGNQARMALGKNPIPKFGEFGWIKDDSSLISSNTIDFGISRDDQLRFLAGEIDTILIRMNITGHVPSIQEMNRKNRKEKQIAEKE
ncbi:MAG: hypothetical protein KBT27_09380 [Prevotellaceae bacterium]|nr:hypothetical protein [Candidatus Faecinaster equi]